MRQTLLLTTICALALLPALAQGAAPEGLPALDEAFGAWERAAAGGDSLALREAEAGVRAALRAIDQEENEVLAAAALLEAERRLEAGASGAGRVAAFAVELAPSFPPAHFLLAEARLRTAPLSIGGWAGPLFEGIASYRLTPRHGRPLARSAAIALLFAALAAGLAALAAALLRHLRRLAHDLGHLLPGRPPAALAAAAALGALALLASLLGGPLLWFGAAALCLSFYLGRQERWGLALFLVAAGQLPLFLSWVEAQTAWADTPAALLDAVDARGELARLPHLRALAEGDAASAEALFALARYEKRAGRPDEAAALYDRALARRPGWPAALVNRGNLDFTSGALDRAKARYERAAELAPTLAEAWFALSRVHYRQVEIGEGQAARERALALRPELADRYNAGEEEAIRTRRYLADVGLSAEALAPLARSSGVLERAGVAALWGPIPGEAAPYAGGALGLLLLLMPLGAVKISRGCIQCGAAVCPRCEGAVEAAEARESCAACRQLVSRPRGLDPAVRNRKEVEIARYARRRRLALRLASFVALGPFLRGKTLWGLLLFTVAGAALALALGGLLPPLFGGWPLGLRAASLLPVPIAIGLSLWVSRGEGA